MAGVRCRWVLVVLFSVVLVTGGCASEPPASRPATPSVTAPMFPLTLTDDEGVEVMLESEPARIVTWAPALTEVVFAVGRGDRLVGVSGPFDDFPPEAAGIEQVGGSNFEPNVEKVVALDPDLVLDGFGGGDTWKAGLREQGIPVFTVLATGYDDAISDIRAVGRLTGAAEGGETVAAGLEEAARSMEARLQGRADVTCFYEVGFEGGFFTVGPGSFIYDLLEKAGCAPATSDATEPFPQWSVEALVRDDPDVYLASSDSVGGSVASIGDRPGFASLTAVATGRVAVIDADLLDRPGPRLGQGLMELVRALHPEVF
jgi:iron complex transport system substrate-binding protein